MAEREVVEDPSLWGQIKQWFCWSWSYLWGVWFLLVVFLLWFLRTPLRLQENISYSTMVLSSLSPKFYVALTGTSSLISGLILMFEWLYYRRYGQSFIETFSIRYLSPFLGTGDAPAPIPGLVSCLSFLPLSKW
jgi:hypothetical protein